MNVTSVSFTNKALSNNIEFSTTSTSGQNADIYLYRHSIQDGSFNDDNIATLLSNINIEDNKITYNDYDISMNNNYKYQLKLGSNKCNVYCYSFDGRIKNPTINYIYNDNSFSLSWDNPHNQDNLDNNTNYIYDIFIKANPIPNSWPSDGIVHFQSDPPSDKYSSSVSYNIVSNSIPDILGESRIFIKDTKYSFYISPRYSPPNDENNFTRGYSKLRLPRYIGRHNLSPPIITNFKESSPYNNNKISFSWDNIADNNFLNYGVMLKKDGILYKNFSETTTNNSYTLDNNNFNYIPGDYSIDISANFSSYIHTKSETLYFNIPVTPITLTLVLDNETITLNWSTIEYAEYYKITVKRINKDGNPENELYFYTNKNITSKDFIIDQTDQVELKFSVSYSEEGIPDDDSDWPYGQSVQISTQTTEFTTLPTEGTYFAMTSEVKLNI